MVVRFKNAPQIMQRAINKVLDDDLREGVNVYMYYAVISVRTRYEHDEQLKAF